MAKFRLEVEDIEEDGKTALLISIARNKFTFGIGDIHIAETRAQQVYVLIKKMLIEIGFDLDDSVKRGNDSKESIPDDDEAN